MSEQMATDRVLMEPDVALRLGVSVHTLRAWRRRGKGPCYLKLGRAVRYRAADVLAFETACEHRGLDCAIETA